MDYRALALCFSMLATGASHATQWVGGAGNNLWSNPGNWVGGVPTAGSPLVFGSQSNFTSVNDIAGLSISTVDITTDGHTMSGNGIALATHLKCANNTNAVINLPIDVQANNVAVTNMEGIALSCSIRALGGLAGSGTITVGAFTLFSAGGPSTFSGGILLGECRNFGCGRLRLEGVSMPNATVYSTETTPVGVSAEVMGNGTIGDATKVSLSPGTTTSVSGLDNGTGIIATKNLDMTARNLRMDLAGLAPGAHDQIAATGTVTLGGASFTLRMAPGFAPPVGHVFKIIDNDGTADAVTGTFSGLPEGSTITEKGFNLQLSYAGGDGNDVTLTVTFAPKVWTGAASALWSNAGNWSGGVAPTTGDMLRFPAGAANLSNTNDLSGLSLASIGFDGEGFTLGGNGVVVTAQLASTVTPANPNSPAPVSNTIALPLDVQGNAVSVTQSHQLSRIRIAGGLAGTGPIAMLSQGAVALAGSGTYSGTITVGCSPPPTQCSRLFLENASFPTTSVTTQLPTTPFAGAVYGTGTIGALTRVGVSPGSETICCVAGFAPGKLSTGSIVGDNRSMSFQIAGATPATGYDQVAVAGTVNLTNTTLALEVSFAFTPTPGHVFTIIENDGTDPVVGRFIGFPQGSSVKVLGGPEFRINYAGGDGNDVTLTALSPAARLVNISTRAQVLTGADVLIAGFVIGGTSPKTVAIRARGPSLAAAGVQGALQDPILQLFQGSTPILANDDWQQAPNAAQIQAYELQPSDPRESVILMTLQPGAYTAIVAGVEGATGVGIVEVFEADQPEVPLVNIATRGRVGANDNVLIAGFIIQGRDPQTIVVRARGPSLAQAGVPGVLANPFLGLYIGQALLTTNDNWQSASNAAETQASGYAPSDPNESAIHITLPPGIYSAIVSGVGGGTGVGIVEVFKVTP